jgi:hypothetical protein
MKYKVDLHTHSTFSYDGGLTLNDYTKIFQNKILDVVAITDHNEIGFALKMQKVFDNKIIIGEEIESIEGEIIGLFLKKKVMPGLNAKETIKEIKQQNGLVYIPHPFEKQRKSIQEEIFEKIYDQIDISEVFNGRSFGRKKDKVFIKKVKYAAASSDAHCILGIGSTFAYMNEIPTRENILRLLESATLSKNYSSLISYLCPLINKIKKKIKL